MNRRQLLSASSFLLVNTALISCASLGTGNTAVANVATDVATIASAFANTIPALAAATGLSASASASVTAAVADLQKAATSLKTAASASAAQPIVTQVETDINTVVGVAAAIPGLPPEVTLALAAAQALLPVIETAVGMVALTRKIGNPKFTRGYSAEKARSLLKGLAMK